jgi:hypothetical protein
MKKALGAFAAFLMLGSFILGCGGGGDGTPPPPGGVNGTVTLVGTSNQ